MAITGKGDAPFRSAYLTNQKHGSAMRQLLPVLVTGDSDVAEKIIWRDFFFPDAGPTPFPPPSPILLMVKTQVG